MSNAPVFLALDDGEMDYVRRVSRGARHILPCDHVWLCAGHHRVTGATAGYVWATANRDLLVRHLAPLRKAAVAAVIESEERHG